MTGIATAAHARVRADAAVDELEVAAYTIPTDAPEADGTLSWDATTIVVVHAHGAGECGLGYTYADVSTAKLIASKLGGIVATAATRCGAAGGVGGDGRADPKPWPTRDHLDGDRRGRRRRLWDLTGARAGPAAGKLLGMARACVPVYGSGGFTAYPAQRLSEQLGAWVEQGIPRVKIKVGSEPDKDPARVLLAREVIGPRAELFVDANGAYTRKQALGLAERFRDQAQVSWFEEPVSSNDLLEGLRLLRDRVRRPGWRDRSRANTATTRSTSSGCSTPERSTFSRPTSPAAPASPSFLRVGALCRAHGVPLSLHCGPSIHLHPATALENFAHLEYFHDHVRIEDMLFDGVVDPVEGALAPDLDRPGIGLELKRGEAERYAA